MVREVDETEDYLNLMEELAEMYETANAQQKSFEVYKRLVGMEIAQSSHAPLWEKYGMAFLRVQIATTRSVDEQVLSEVEQIVAKYPDSIDLRTELSSVYQMLGRERDSLKILESILVSE